MLRSSFLAGLFLAAILLANYVTTEYGMVSVGFGLTATAGTYLAGLTFVLRDSLQDAIRASLTREGRGWWGIPIISRPSDLAVAVRVAVVIAAGAALSLLLAATWFRADPAHLPPGVTPLSIALASGAAFGLSELADLLAYTPLRRRGYVRAALASNVVGTFADTFVFLSLAGFPMAAAWQGQVVGKLTVTAVAVALVMAVRVQRRVVAA